MPKQTLPPAGGYIFKQGETANTGVFVTTGQATTNAMKCDWVSILKSA